MDVEITETTTFLEITEAAGSQVSPTESSQVVSPAGDTEVIVEVQEAAANVLQVTESTTIVEVTTEVVSVIHEASGPAGPAGPPGDETTSDYDAGEAIGGQRVVMLAADGLLYYADRSEPTHFNRVLGITAGAVGLGGSPTVRFHGIMTEPTWAWDLTKFIYLGTNGLLTQIPPAAGFLLQMGWPLSPTSMMVDIKLPILIV